MFWLFIISTFMSTAYADGQAPQQPSSIEMFMPFIFILGIFYFLIIRPQSKRQKEHQSYLSGLKRGDDVITASGILGTIDGITDQFVTLDVGNGVKLKMLRSQVASSQKSVIQQQQQEGKK